MNKTTIDRILKWGTLVLIIAAFALAGLHVDKLFVSGCLILGGICWFIHVAFTGKQEKRREDYFRRY